MRIKNQFTLRLLLIVIISGFVWSCTNNSSDNSEGRNAEGEENSLENDFYPIFNGKDLTGWEVKNGKAPFKVENGVIVGTFVPGTPNTFLCTNDTYGDFILEFEAWLGSGNSGVMFRAQAKEEYNNGRVHGYQMELDSEPRDWTGGIFDEARRDWLYPMEYNQESKGTFVKSEWNSFRIEAIGNELRTWVNGVPMAYLIDDVDAEGFIGLQVHSIAENSDIEGDVVKFRNIRICTSNLDQHITNEGREITKVSYLTNQLTKYEEEEGWKLLWDGKTTEGWRGARLKTFPEKGWFIEDGQLVVDANDGAESENGGDIVTVDEYENFILEVDFKMTEGTNSGIKYFVDTELNKGTGSAIGCEFQIVDDDIHSDAQEGKNGNRTVASLYDLITADARRYTSDLPKAKWINKYGWNRAKVIVRGDDVEHYLNGVLVVKYNRSGQQWKDRVAKSKYVQWPDFGEARTGNILLQEHGYQVYFRNIKIKTL